MKNATLNNVKLKSSNNHLLNKFTKHVKKNNGPEGLEDIISKFIWLGYNNKSWLLEVSRLVLQ